MSEYLAEGITWRKDLAFPDNSAQLGLIEGRGDVFDLLDEECVVPQGSDATLVDKMFQQLVGNKRLKRPLKRKSCFQVRARARARARVRVIASRGRAASR